MSSLGMNTKGEVRTASEFKDIFIDSGSSHGPYKCPFCEVAYHDRCITTKCVKAPHFALPKDTDHRNGCNGEAQDTLPTSVASDLTKLKRTVVGEVELPEVLVDRRKPRHVFSPRDDGQKQLPDAVEVARRRNLIRSDETIASRFTTSLLGEIVNAYIGLRARAGEAAVAAKLKKGTKEYNDKFGEIVNAPPLSLYKEKFTYGKAFQNHHLCPAHKARIYFGRGVVRAENGYFFILDYDKWPTKVKDKDSLVPFEIKISQALPPNAPASHLSILKELEALVSSRKTLAWWAYGPAELHNEKFELIVSSLDHLYWDDQHKR